MSVREDVLRDHQIDHRYDTALHEQCNCGRRWMGGRGKLAAHHEELIAAHEREQDQLRRIPTYPNCATCDGGGCGDCVD